MSLHLLVSAFVSFRPVSKVPLYPGFCTILTRLISKHFISFSTVVCGVVSTVMSSDWSLLCMGRRLDSLCEFCVLLLA